MANGEHIVPHINKPGTDEWIPTDSAAINDGNERVDVARIKETERQLAQTELKISYKEKQTTLIAKAYEKIKTAQPFTLEMQGDSLTYGHDTTSSDVRPPDSNHTATKASVTYPEALKRCLSEVYGESKVAVINRGYSGDTTKSSFERWTNPSGADIALIMLGTNDASKQSIADYLSWYRKIIERHLDNGTAVIISTPPKTRNTTDTKTGSYVNSLLTFVTEYGINIVNTQELMANYSQDIYSDNVHYNGKGYNILGCRKAALFIGDGLLNPKAVDIGSSLSIRPMIDSVTFNPLKAIVSAGGFPTPDEQVSGQGIAVSLSNNNCAYYSFYVDTDDVVISPSIYFPTSFSSAEVSLDFGIEIPHMTNDFNRGSMIATPSDRPSNPVTLTKADANISGSSIALAGFNSFSRNKVIHVTKKGWHTLKIKCIDVQSSGFQLHSIDFSSLRDLLTRGLLSETTNHGAWSSANLQNAIANSTYPIQYRKNKQNYTEIRGAFVVTTGSSGTQIFTFPTGLRPDSQITLICSNNGTTPVNLLVIKTNGVVELGSTLNSNTTVFIGSQSFEATQ